MRNSVPALAALVSLVLFTSPAAGAPVAAPARQLTKVAYGADFIISGTTAPIYLAIERGYFAERGIEVSISRGFGSADAVKRAATGQADIVQGDIGTAMLLRANEGAEVKLVSPLYEKLPHAVLYYEDTGITQPKDLEGKTLTDAPGSAPRQIFPAFAALAGVDLSRVDWRSVDPTVRNPNFAAGQFDVMTAFILNLADVEALAYSQNPGRRIAAMRYADYGVDMYGNGYITSDRMIAERPDAVAAFVEGAAMGLRDTYQDVPGAVDAVIRYNPTVNREVGIRQLELIRDLVLGDDARTAGIGSFNPARLERTRQIMLQYLGMKGDLPLADVHAPQFAPATPVFP